MISTRDFYKIASFIIFQVKLQSDGSSHFSQNSEESDGRCTLKVIDLLVTIDIENTGDSPLDASMTKLGSSIITTDKFAHLTKTYSTQILSKHSRFLPEAGNHGVRILN